MIKDCSPVAGQSFTMEDWIDLPSQVAVEPRRQEMEESICLVLKMAPTRLKFLLAVNRAVGNVSFASRTSRTTIRTWSREICR